VGADGLQHPGPLLLVSLPLLAAAYLSLSALVPRLRLGPLAQHALVLATTIATLVGALALASLVLRHGFVEIEVPALLAQLRFRLDGMGALLVLLASFVWSCSTLHASAYFVDDAPRKGRRYHLTSLLALAAMLTVLTAADLVTLYVGFEWLGLIAYLLVIHTGTKTAEAAGLKYLVLTLLGGFVVLAGVLLVHALGGGDLASPLALAGEQRGLRDAAALCLLLGFGLKAGAIGLHSWLPDAHASAPAPASALLSGMMIKAGAYGIVRTIDILYRGEAEPLLAAVAQARGLGLAVLWWGVATMLVGVLLAVTQHQAKRLLAYSSVSQMGFVLAGIGAATYLGPDGGIGWVGSLLHVVNHGLFKALLFLGIGAVIATMGTGDLRRLGGVCRTMPWTCALVAIGVAGIVGVPLLNGFVSKSVIHHALEYAVAQDRSGGGAHGLIVAERLYLLTTVGTAAALLKLFTLTFLGRSREGLATALDHDDHPAREPERPAREAPPAMLLAMAALAAAVAALGLRPELAAPLLANALERWHLPSGGVQGWLSAPLGHPGDLRAALLGLALGALLHLVASRTGLYARAFPAWLSLDWLVAAAARRGRAGWEVLGELRATGPEALGRRLRTRRTAWRTDASTTPRRLAAVASRDRLEALARRLPALDTALVDSGARRLGRRWREALRHAASLAQRLDASWRVAREFGPLGEAERERLLRSGRARIQRESRDVGLGMALVVFVWLLMAASLALLGGR
jgi:formate hydrogenlyase subunit 3/multisubunit Na+/H+ antiporter MnhD subunit